VQKKVEGWIEKLNGKEDANLQFRKSTLEGY